MGAAVGVDAVIARRGNKEVSGGSGIDDIIRCIEDTALVQGFAIVKGFQLIVGAADDNLCVQLRYRRRIEDTACCAGGEVSGGQADH